MRKGILIALIMLIFFIAIASFFNNQVETIVVDSDFNN